jgi:hypothetical protein
MLGPTVSDDGSSWDDACRLVNAYGLNAGGEQELPMAVLELLLMENDGTLDDKPKSSHSNRNYTARLSYWATMMQLYWLRQKKPQK